MPKLLKYTFHILLIIEVNFVLSQPWYGPDNEMIQQEIDQLRLCGIEIPAISAFPLNISILNLAIKNSDKLSLSKECQQILYIFEREVKKKLYSRKNIIGFQTQRPDIYFQDFGKRQTANPHVYLSSSKIDKNFAYNFSLQAFKGSHRFDESYFSYFSNNYVLTLGRTSRWWSPSHNSSLILSNSARPSPGISFSNYHPKKIRSKYLSFLGPVSYEVFINKLEKDRHIPNALLFGNRVSFQPNYRTKISLFRVAQLGGEGRRLNSEIFINMLIGKDNYSRDDINKKNEPGNQLGGLDFNLLLLRNENLSIYGQIVGEDESGYLPSKTFYSLGIGYSWNLFNPKKVNIEYIDTGSRQKNITYNHSIYKDGYRYYGIPIGSSFDADSRVLGIIYNQKIKNNSYINIRAIKASLNYNNSDTYFINGLSDEVSMIEMNLKKIISKNINFGITLQYSDFLNTISYDSFNTNASLEYRW